MIKFTELDETDKECLMTLENFKKMYHVGCEVIVINDVDVSSEEELATA